MTEYSPPKAVVYMPKCFGCIHYHGANVVYEQAFCPMGYSRFPNLGAECHDFDDRHDQAPEDPATV